jgi:hypothetical protein
MVLTFSVIGTGSFLQETMVRIHPKNKVEPSSSCFFIKGLSNLVREDMAFDQGKYLRFCQTMWIDAKKSCCIGMQQLYNS